MLKNEIINAKNAKIKIPLIERIIVCGVSKKQLTDIKISILNNEELLIEHLSNLSIDILEEYSSSLINIDKNSKSSYILNIPNYSIPFGLSPEIIKNKTNTKYESDKKIISFSLVQDTKLKHCSSLSFYENYKINTKDVLIKKSITLVSSKDYYETQKQILEYIYKIIYNYYSNQTKIKILIYFRKLFMKIIFLVKKYLYKSIP